MTAGKEPDSATDMTGDQYTAFSDADEGVRTSGGETDQAPSTAPPVSLNHISVTTADRQLLPVWIGSSSPDPVSPEPTRSGNGATVGPPAAAPAHTEATPATGSTAPAIAASSVLAPASPATTAGESTTASLPSTAGPVSRSTVDGPVRRRRQAIKAILQGLLVLVAVGLIGVLAVVALRALLDDGSRDASAADGDRSGAAVDPNSASANDESGAGAVSESDADATAGPAGEGSDGFGSGPAAAAEGATVEGETDGTDGTAPGADAADPAADAADDPGSSTGSADGADPAEPARAGALGALDPSVDGTADSASPSGDPATTSTTATTPRPSSTPPSSGQTSRPSSPSTATTRASSTTTRPPSTTTTRPATTTPPPTTATNPAPTPSSAPPAAPSGSLIASPTQATIIAWDGPVRFVANDVPGAARYCWSLRGSGGTYDECSSSTAITLDAESSPPGPGPVSVGLRAESASGAELDSQRIVVRLIATNIVESPAAGEAVPLDEDLEVEAVDLPSAGLHCWRLAQGTTSTDRRCGTAAEATFSAADLSRFEPGPAIVWLTVRDASFVIGRNSLTFQFTQP